ncbi:hypothetical protein V8G54_021602 [Vigna mungo]|uniref:Uncharacterized protein n=1 Tax=Vigna mungo TaxID=3915 RepID=A0AAQ3NFW5_VIGMU
MKRELHLNERERSLRSSHHRRLTLVLTSHHRRRRAIVHRKRCLPSTQSLSPDAMPLTNVPPPSASSRANEPPPPPESHHPSEVGPSSCCLLPAHRAAAVQRQNIDIFFSPPNDPVPSKCHRSSTEAPPQCRRSTLIKRYFLHFFPQICMSISFH